MFLGEVPREDLGWVADFALRSLHSQGTMSSQNVTILVSKSFVRDMPAADFALRFLHSRGTMSFQNVSILVSKSFVRDMLRTKRVIDQLSEILSTGKASRSDRVKGKSVDIAVGILTREQQLLRLIEEPNNLEVELTECIVLPEEPNPDQDWPSSVEQKQEERANMDPVLYARWDEFESYYHVTHNARSPNNGGKYLHHNDSD